MEGLCRFADAVFLFVEPRSTPRGKQSPREIVRVIHNYDIAHRGLLFHELEMGIAISGGTIYPRGVRCERSMDSVAGSCIFEKLEASTLFRISPVAPLGVVRMACVVCVSVSRRVALTLESVRLPDRTARLPALRHDQRDVIALLARRVRVHLVDNRVQQVR
jgi:hypothetical protein